jgi:hypothetical protein
MMLNSTSSDAATLYYKVKTTYVHLWPEL